MKSFLGIALILGLWFGPPLYQYYERSIKSYGAITLRYHPTTGACLSVKEKYSDGTVVVRDCGYEEGKPYATEPAF